ncbi:hypothetical protein [Chelativorans sp. AA-79]|uniref:hypothetical protein n=1 Tax=Chelativorans sp. AA-79 TaxID=3028735 RepID=UPI0023F674DF|nr:hypothetical protein [Chelativorans sp. AA-79]WEX10461.1 hypothetical protein PVE73_05745 [Chelativorans sp. AA-79]
MMVVQMSNPGLLPLTPSGLSAISPQGGDRLLQWLSPIAAVAEETVEQAAGVISPLEGEMAGRPEGGVKRGNFNDQAPTHG